MWMIGEEEEQDPSLLYGQAEDIRDKNFTGVLAVPRAGVLDIRDPKYLEIFKMAVDAAKSSGLEIWLMADPRLASDSLINDTGEALEVLIPIIMADEGEEIPTPGLRPTHMHQGGGINYKFTGIERSYSLGKNEQLVFPRYRTNFFDYSNPCMWAFWEEYIGEVFEKIRGFTGLCWDEPGFYCDGGRFPYGKYITGEFLGRYGYDIGDHLLNLQIDSPDWKHIKIRNDYYSLVNSIVADSMRKNFELIGRYTEKLEKFTIGIHATWHGEFCGIEERSHGSMDLWKLRPYQTASFTDIGECEKLVEPEKGPDVVYSLVLARSLSRIGPNRGLIYSNLWGIDFGKGRNSTPFEILDYWADLLGLFGARWIAHAYGWPGTRFKDLNFGPGYPDHPTWERFESVNEKINKSTAENADVEQVADVLVVYPLESFYAVGRGDHREMTWDFVRLIDKLARSGYQVDVVSSEWLKDAKIEDESIVLNGCEYNSIIVPHCNVISDIVHTLINNAANAGIPVIIGIYGDEIRHMSGMPAIMPKSAVIIAKDDDPLDVIGQTIEPTFVLPNGALANVFRTPSGYKIHLIPDRPFGKFSGIFEYAGYELDIKSRTEPYLIELPFE